MGELEIKHFLVIYDINAGVAQVQEFGTDNDAALDAYAEAEEEARARTDVDIVLLGADSRETIERTHSSYFKTETFERFLPPGVLAR